MNKFEPKPSPFTCGTWPKQVVWLRFVGNVGEKCFMVSGLHADGIIIRNVNYSFEQLMSKGWEISLDFCQTWQPCHYAPNPTE